MEVREATLDDVERIRAIHCEAIVELASTAYDPEQIDAWVTPVETAEYKGITDDDRYFVVAEANPEACETDDEEVETNGATPNPDGELWKPNDDVIGFASVRFESPEGYESSVDADVTGVYVHPAVARKGVGSALLSEIEREAADRGIKTLGLEASINAVPFYGHHGYDRVRECVHSFGGRVDGPAIEMRKEL